MFAGSFAPSGWMTCQGQLVAIENAETLFNLIGTTYGGDGQETFALPDLQGRVAVHQGEGSGLSNYVIGQAAGAENVTLSLAQIPVHNHNALTVSGGAGGNSSKVTNTTYFADQAATVPGGGSVFVYAPPGTQEAMASSIVGSTGGNQPHNNIQPVMAVTYIISLFGIFPSQT